MVNMEENTKFSRQRKDGFHRRDTLLSLCVATIMERELRQGMARNGLKSIPIYPEERECQHPTAPSIIRAFQNVEKFEVVDRDDNVTEYFPPLLTPLQKQILNLMDVPATLYA